MRAKNTRDKYRKNRKNNKFNKIPRLRKRRNEERFRNVPKYRKNRKSNKDFSCYLKTTMTNIAKNNKSNKNQDLKRGEAKKGPEMSSKLNVAKNAKVTRIFLGN